MVAGLPVLVSDQVDEDTVFWAIPNQHVMFVQRKGTAVERFPNVRQDGIVAADVTVTGSAGVYTFTVPGVLTADGASLTGGSPAATATLTRV